MDVLGEYKNGNYDVQIWSDGSKIRYNDKDSLTPEFPESIDVTISKKCNNRCRFCYANCAPDGNDADIMLASFVDKLHPYTELALNGNEPLHPDLVPFLEKCKKLKLIPSLTVSQKTFLGNVGLLFDLCKDELLYGIGVSVNKIDYNLISNLKKFPNAVVHMINGLHSIEDFKALARYDLKVLILGYKTCGRGVEYFDEVGIDVLHKQNDLHDNIEQIIEDGWFDVVSFDNLAIKQLELRRIMSDKEWSRFYMGDDSEFTFYIDMVDGYFAKNSMSDEHYDLLNDAVDMFNIVRKKRY